MTRRFLTTLVRTIQSAALGVALLLCAPVMAQDIQITSANGALTLTGRFISYDGDYLQVESVYGPLTVRFGDMTCVGAACPDPDTYVPTIRLSGAARMADVLLPGLIEGFGRSQGYRVVFEQTDPTHALLTVQRGDVPVANFVVRSSTTDEGFADLVAYEADIVMSLREVRAGEVKIAEDIGVGRFDQGEQSRIVALDALVPVVAPGHPLRAIALRDLARIFAGRVTHWEDVGGRTGPISLHLLSPDHGLTQAFEDRVVVAGLTDAVTYHATLDSLIAAVVSDPAALGMAPWTKAAFARQLTLVDQCGYSHVPRAERLKAEDYPLAMPMFLYLPDRRQTPIVRDFLSWLRTPDAQLVVRRSGFVDPGAVPIALAEQGQRFANAISLAGDEVSLKDLQSMVDLMKPRTRLSSTFRFEVGETQLDAQSRAGLLDLAQAIRDGRYDGRELTFIGFSDGRGKAVANRELSLARAVAVERALLAILGDVPVKIRTEAFGEALPMGCDDSVWGRKLNRRVELWVD